MTYDRFFQDLSDFVLAGDYDAIADRCDLALPVFVEDRILVYPTRAAVRDGLEIYRGILRRDGVARVQTRVIAQSLARGIHCSFWVDTTYRDSRDQTVGQATVRYFCRRAGGSLLIQMMEYLETSWARRVGDFGTYLAA